jgi:hypothetical protein
MNLKPRLKMNMKVAATSFSSGGSCRGGRRTALQVEGILPDHNDRDVSEKKGAAEELELEGDHMHDAAVSAAPVHPSSSGRSPPCRRFSG